MIKSAPVFVLVLAIVLFGGGWIVRGIWNEEKMQTVEQRNATLTDKVAGLEKVLASLSEGFDEQRDAIGNLNLRIRTMQANYRRLSPVLSDLGQVGRITHFSTGHRAAFRVGQAGELSVFNGPGWTIKLDNYGIDDDGLRAHVLLLIEDTKFTSDNICMISTNPRWFYRLAQANTRSFYLYVEKYENQSIYYSFAVVEHADSKQKVICGPTRAADD